MKKEISDDDVHSIRAAVAAATREKFMFSIWDGAFVIANRYSIDSLHWIEWDKGPCGSRLGTLNLSFQAGRLQQRSCKIGIVKIADHSSTTWPDDNVFEKLTHWIKTDGAMLVTGYFGQGNDAGIAKSAVAAGASVNQRVRVALQPPDNDGPVYGPGGFLVFAPCE